VLDATVATEPAPGHASEDYHLVAARWALVLDGASRDPASEVGCHHDVPWFVARLGSYLGAAIATAGPETPLTEALAAAIRRTATDHEDSCDLTHPLTPGATVAAVRASPDRIDWLVLGDATAAWQTTTGDTESITDNRLDQLEGGPIVVTDVRRYRADYVARVRNRPGGFWVAAADPVAAQQALTGSIPARDVTTVGLFTDGVTRLVERYGWTWPQVFTVAREGGPRALIDVVRKAEHGDPDPTRWRGKPHDDATAVIGRVIHFGSDPTAGSSHHRGSAG
jgi:hypothetical protein